MVSARQAPGVAACPPLAAAVQSSVHAGTFRQRHFSESPIVEACCEIASSALEIEQRVLGSRWRARGCE
eukprot:5130509-Pleurochrysis_carterae.AAC.2